MDYIRNLILVLCLYSCDGLLNGTQITTGQFAAHVLISLPNGKLCGGEIISSAHILTASSCVFNEYNELLAPTNITVAAKWNISISPLTAELRDLDIAAIYVHPQFNPYSKENDVAVLRLFRDLALELDVLQPFLSKADLAIRIIPDETSCLLSGSNESETISELVYTQLPIINRIDCNKNEEYMFGIKEGMICAGATDENSLCESDIGSGLYCGGNLAGILSFGAACGDSYPGVFTQIRMYSAWITSQLQRRDVPKAGPTPPPSNNRSTSSAKHSGISLIYLIFLVYFRNVNIS